MKYLFLFLFVPFVASAQTYSEDQFGVGTVTCSSNDGTAVCARSIDGSETTEWYSNNTMPANWVNDLGSAIEINRIGIRMNNSGGDHLLRDFEVLGSTDNANFDSLGVFEFADLNNWQYFDLTNGTAYQYYKVNITDNWRVDNYVGFYEIEGYTCTDCTEPEVVASSTAQTYGDWLFMSSVQVFLLSFIAIGMLFSLFKVKR